MTIQEQILSKNVRLSYSSLHNFLKSPEHFIEYKINTSPDTDATLFGRAFHCFVLQNNEFNNRFMIFDETKRPDPGKDYRVTVNKEWKAKQFEQAKNENKGLIEKSDYDKIQLMNDKLLSCDPSRELIQYTRAKFEVEKDFIRKNLKFKSFIDIESDVFLSDLKTTNNAEPAYFQRDIYKFGYDLQTAVYNDASSRGNAKFNKLKEFYFIAIEKTPPFGVSVHKFGEVALNFAFEEYLNALDKFNECLNNPELFERTYDYFCSDNVLM